VHFRGQPRLETSSRGSVRHAGIIRQIAVRVE
jgi:hypothetical protein